MTRFQHLLCKASIYLPAILLMAQPPYPQPQINQVRADLDFLTSGVLAGRASLTPEADIAARYIAAEFQKAGLAPANADSYLQRFPLVAYRADLARRGLTLGRAGRVKAFDGGSDFLGSFYRDVDIKAPVVFAGYGITAPEYGYDDYANLDVKGKIVLIFDHEPQEADPRSIFNGEGHTLHAGRWMKVANARRHGAIGLLIGNGPLHHTSGAFSNKQTVGASLSLRASAPPQALDDPDQIPVFLISDITFAELLLPTHDSPRQLQEQIDSGLKPYSSLLADTTVEMSVANAEQHRGVSMNAVGFLEGSDPNLKGDTVILTAHYDHLGIQNGRLYPGANDNASGTAAVMELARIFGRQEVRPKRSLLFIVFGSEEQLMLGSFFYTGHPLRSLERTRAVINLDMIGRNEAHIAQNEGHLQIPADTTNEINLVGSFYSPALRSIILREDRRVGLQLDTKYDSDRTLNALFRCDHLPFLIAHVPAVWFFAGFHPGYHEPSDTVDKLNFPKIKKVIELAYLTSLAVANTPAPPRFVPEGQALHGAFSSRRDGHPQ